MKRIFITLLACLIGLYGFSQTTALRVYQILQDKCATCHSGASPAANLDLQGTGANPAVAVYNRVVTDGSVANAYAQTKGYKQIYPGRYDKSFMFRKINEGLEPTIALDPAESDGTVHGDAGLTNVEKEILRQWIMFGANTTNEVVDESLLVSFYAGNGVPSFPQGPPPPPDPSEGFQIKMGPYFLDDVAGLNEEWFLKYELDLGNDREIVRLETFMSPASHHFIVYDFNNKSDADNMQAGLRPNANHTNTSLVSAVQEPTNLKLPQGSAFIWDSDQVLDLNSHYINYTGAPMSAEAYLNIYTKPSGTAAQEMQAILLPNTNICIPADGQEHTTTASISLPIFDEVYAWGLMGHTHKYGTGYKIYTGDVLGNTNELLYDGSCPNGVPGCPSPYFDYQHIPLRYYNPFKPLLLDGFNTLIHEASWVNTGTEEVCWGDTSDDEMMVLIGFYLTDTTGVTLDPTTPTVITEPDNSLESIEVYPNPMSDWVIFDLPNGYNNLSIKLYDLLGREVHQATGLASGEYTMSRNSLAKGMYVYRVEDTEGNFTSGKLMVE